MRSYDRLVQSVTEALEGRKIEASPAVVHPLFYGRVPLLYRPSHPPSDLAKRRERR